MTFEEWLEENERPIWDATATTTLLELAYNAGIEEGRRLGIERAAEIAENHPYTVDINDSVGNAILAEIKE